MATPEDIEQGIAHLVARWDGYGKFERYYLGEFETVFASDAFRRSFGKMVKRLQYNRCATVVNAIANRLQIESWQDASATSAKDRESGAAIDAWRQVRGPEVSGMINVEHVKKGDAYLLVWPDAEVENLPRWRMQRAESCGMVYNEETAEPEYGFKLWCVDYGPDKGKYRLTIYAADEITRYITTNKVETDLGLYAGGAAFKPDAFVPYADENGDEQTDNPFGVVPLFHFRNNPPHQTAYGRSELEDVIGLQDAANYALWSLMIGMEFTAWPQKVAIGVERLGDDDEEINLGVDRWLTVGNNLANLYTIPGAPLEPFNSTIDEIDALISRATTVPVHWLGLVSVSSQISGETVKALEAPFTSMIDDRINGLDVPYSAAMALDQRIRGGSTSADAPSAGDIVPIWKSPETRSDMETWTIAQLKKNAGVPETQLWKEGGYSAEQIQAFTEENKRIAQEQAELFATKFAQGSDTGFEGSADAGA